MMLFYVSRDTLNKFFDPQVDDFTLYRTPVNGPSEFFVRRKGNQVIMSYPSIHDCIG